MDACGVCVMIAVAIPAVACGRRWKIVRLGRTDQTYGEEKMSIGEIIAYTFIYWKHTSFD